MMLANLSDMVPLIRPEMRDCMDVVIEDAIRRAAIAFCEDSHALEVDAYPIQTADGIAEYDLDMPPDQVVIRVSRVEGPHGRLDPLTQREMDMTGHTWMTVKGGSPHKWIMVGPRRIRFYPVPGVVENYSVKIIVKPTLTATTIEQQIIDDYADGITAKAKALLGAMPHKAWTNLQMVPYWESQYRDCVSRARMRVATGYSHADMRVVPVRFGG